MEEVRDDNGLDREVVSEERIGNTGEGFLVQILEGPTDNPIRIIAAWGHRYTYWVEGVGWRLLRRILDPEVSSEIKEERIRHLVELTKGNPDILGSTNRPAIDL